jgi:Zn-dependent membrane protease YugP
MGLSNKYPTNICGEDIVNERLGIRYSVKESFTNKCDFFKRTIGLRKPKNYNIVSCAVAAHESSHALQFRRFPMMLIMYVWVIFAILGNLSMSVVWFMLIFFYHSPLIWYFLTPFFISAGLSLIVEADAWLQAYIYIHKKFKSPKLTFETIKTSIYCYSTYIIQFAIVFYFMNRHYHWIS